MDKRFFLALLLTAIVVVATPLLFPGSARKPVPSIVVDSAAAVRAAMPESASTASNVSAPAVAVAASAVQNQPPAPVETTTVHVARSTYAFSSRGAVPVSVVLDSYPALNP